ncbi:uncharacterized protein LOC136019610 isoform X4 [Lathamus discolor]|uniref:uncharacterized protein LOC136019610 isoform X4 n=1 Tax=Lathamus discolor TaxID=678569 RepID=UPI0032B76E9A
MDPRKPCVTFTRLGEGEMAPQRMVVTLALLLGGCCTSAYPAYPESNRAQALKPTDFSLADGAGGFMAESKPAAGLRPSKSLNQALPAPWEGVSHDQRAARGNGEKRALQEDVPGPLGEDLDAFLWKMVAMGNLQSQGFTQADQAPPQPNKRACFWKYCVTK